MTIGTLLMWNFGKRICSSKFHYPLQMITASEKTCDLTKQNKTVGGAEATWQVPTMHT